MVVGGEVGVVVGIEDSTAVGGTVGCIIGLDEGCTVGRDDGGGKPLLFPIKIIQYYFG